MRNATGPQSQRPRWPTSPFKNPHLVASGVSRIIILLGIAVRSDPAHAGCYFFNGLPSAAELPALSVLFHLLRTGTVRAPGQCPDVPQSVDWFWIEYRAAAIR